MSIIPQHLSSDIRRGFVNISPDDDDVISHTERKLRTGSALTLALWVTLVTVVRTLAPTESYETPEGIDRDSHLLTALLIFVVTCVRVMQMLMKERGTGFLKSGIVVGTIAVQGIALVSKSSSITRLISRDFIGKFYVS